ncbi:MAG TPA: hypothetical protein DD423_05460 [Opitutae bacterium]|jgi:hypothetical protein|nr:hypothetical protein [Opitutae bacterium]
MDDTLFIDLEQTQLLPGQHVAGKILWALEKGPKEIRLSLGWSTEGRGSRDDKIEAELNWSTEATSGEESFEFTLPASPYSFDGTLISLNWALTLSVKKGKATHQLPITVSPHAEAIALSAVPNESKRKPFSFLKR